ncbi:hypothetical protein [Nocardia australiensis]|uniref:hypothetical protein n=1 Tax=Nocardia australiensis TaxID=2887191 RepID=UPI001D133AB5|nr:hypothetical protein [Nocardia australiensis]
MNKCDKAALSETVREQGGERPDLVAWRRRNALRRSSAAQPIPSKRQYRRTSKHHNRSHD